MAGKYTNVNFLERIGNFFDAGLENQRYVDKARKEYNQYADYYRNKELAELKQQREAAVVAAKRDYAGDKAGLEDALNKITSEYDGKESMVKDKYKPWDKHAHFDANASTTSKVYDPASGQYVNVSNLDRAKNWIKHKDTLMAEESEEGDKMRAVFNNTASNEDNTGDTDKPAEDTDNSGSEEDKDKRRKGINNNVAMDIADRVHGRDPSGRSNQLRRQAQMHDVQAADEQKNSQANFQIANRNARVEADKDAVATSAVKNAQTVNNLASGTSAGTAALNRTVEQGNVDAHRQRADQQRQEGVSNQREMWGSRQTAEEERGAANITDYQYRQSRGQTAMTDYLSQPGHDKDTGDTGGKDKPSEPAGYDTGIGQQFVNYALGYMYSDGGIKVTDAEKQAAESVIAKYPGIKRVPPGTFQDMGYEPKQAEDAFIEDDRYGGTTEQRAALMKELRTLRNSDNPEANTSEEAAYAASDTHIIKDGELMDQAALNSTLTSVNR